MEIAVTADVAKRGIFDELLDGCFNVSCGKLYRHFGYNSDTDSGRRVKKALKNRARIAL